MWWMFVKLWETETEVCYSYAMQSRDTDGEMVYQKGSDELPTITKPSVTTISDFSKEKAAQKFYHVARDGYPDRRQVACG